MTGYQPIVIPFNYPGINFLGVTNGIWTRTDKVTTCSATDYTMATPKKSNKTGTPNWNRTNDSEFKARCVTITLWRNKKKTNA